MNERQRVQSDGWEQRAGFSRAVCAAGRVWVSLTPGAHPDGTVPDDVVAQTRVALRTVERALTEAGSSLDQVVMVRAYFVQESDREVIAAALRERLGALGPAGAFVQVTALQQPEQRVALEAEAVAGATR